MCEEIIKKTRSLGTDTDVDQMSLDAASVDENGTQYFLKAPSGTQDPGMISGLGMHPPEVIQDIQVYFETKHARHQSSREVSPRAEFQGGPRYQMETQIKVKKKKKKWPKRSKGAANQGTGGDYIPQNELDQDTEKSKSQTKAQRLGFSLVPLINLQTRNPHIQLIGRQFTKEATPNNIINISKNTVKHQQANNVSVGDSMVELTSIKMFKTQAPIDAKPNNNTNVPNQIQYLKNMKILIENQKRKQQRSLLIQNTDKPGTVSMLLPHDPAQVFQNDFFEQQNKILLSQRSQELTAKKRQQMNKTTTTATQINTSQELVGGLGTTQNTQRNTKNNLILQDGITQMQQQWRSLTRKHICAPTLMKELTQQHQNRISIAHHDRSLSSNTEEEISSSSKPHFNRLRRDIQPRTQNIQSRNTLNLSKTEEIKQQRGRTDRLPQVILNNTMFKKLKEQASLLNKDLVGLGEEQQSFVSHSDFFPVHTRRSIQQQHRSALLKIKFTNSMNKAKAKHRIIIGATEPQIMIQNNYNSDQQQQILFNKTFNISSNEKEVQGQHLNLTQPINGGTRLDQDYEDSLSPLSYSTGINYKPPQSSDSNWGGKRGQRFRTYYPPQIQMNQTNNPQILTNILTTSDNAVIDQNIISEQHKTINDSSQLQTIQPPQLLTVENAKRVGTGIVHSHKNLEFRQSHSQFDFTQLGTDHSGIHNPLIRSSLDAALQAASLSNPPKTAASRAGRSTIMSRMPVTSIHIRKQTFDHGVVSVVKHNRSGTGSSLQGRHVKKDSNIIDGPSMNPEQPKVIVAQPPTLLKDQKQLKKHSKQAKENILATRTVNLSTQDIGQLNSSQTLGLKIGKPGIGFDQSMRNQHSLGRQLYQSMISGRHKNGAQVVESFNRRNTALIQYLKMKQNK